MSPTTDGYSEQVMSPSTLACWQSTADLKSYKGEKLQGPGDYHDWILDGLRTLKDVGSVA